MSIVVVLAENTSTLFPIHAEIPSSASPAVTKGKSPDTLSALFNRFPRVDLPKRCSRLKSPHLSGKCEANSLSLSLRKYRAVSKGF